MKNRKSKVFILGAGASVESGVPLVKDVLKEILNDYPAYNSDARAFNFGTLPVDFIPKYQKALKIIDDLCGTNLTKLLETEVKAGQLISEEDISNSNFRFEEFLSRIDDSIKNKKIYNGYSHQSLEEARPFLHYIIFNTLDRGQKDKKLYRDFVRLLSGNDNCYLISFNYDTLLDRALFDYYFKNSKQVMSWSYGIQFDYVDEYSFPSYNKESRNISIHLLKPHGSFNWRYCNKCSKTSLYYCPSYCTATKLNMAKCPVCGVVACETLLVPPSSVKRLDKIPLLNDAKSRIEEALKQCCELIIIGYSLPPEDWEVQDILKNNIPSKQRPDVQIVNTSNKDIERIREFLKGKYNKYKEFCGTFSEYLRSLKV